MKTYNFTLVLLGIKEPSEAFENALFEVGCDDATLSFRNLIAYLDFDREVASFEKGVISAIGQVEKINPSIRVKRVEPDDLVTISEIAFRLNKSREYIRLLTEGKRGKGDFPVPISGISNKSLIWSWVNVAKWLRENNLIDDESLEIGQCIADINHILFYRSDHTVNKRIDNLKQLLSVA